MIKVTAINPVHVIEQHMAEYKKEAPLTSRALLAYKNISVLKTIKL